MPKLQRPTPRGAYRGEYKTVVARLTKVGVRPELVPIRPDAITPAGVLHGLDLWNASRHEIEQSRRRSRRNGWSFLFDRQPWCHVPAETAAGIFAAFRSEQRRLHRPTTNRPVRTKP